MYFVASVCLYVRVIKSCKPKVFDGSSVKKNYCTVHCLLIALLNFKIKPKSYSNSLHV